MEQLPSAAVEGKGLYFGSRLEAAIYEGDGARGPYGMNESVSNLSFPARLLQRSNDAPTLCGVIVVLSLLLFAQGLSAKDTVTFTIVDRVEFSVPGEWPVIASKSDPVRTTFAFQVPNPADAGTNDSTNLVLLSYYLDDSSAKAAFEKKATKQDPKAEEEKIVDGWSCSSFSAPQGSTPYEIWDCNRIVSGIGVYVRMAWPHLGKNKSDYNKSMVIVLTDFLRSVTASPKQAPHGS
jgi:hypothetical protein